MNIFGKRNAVAAAGDPRPPTVPFATHLSVNFHEETVTGKP